MNYPQQIKPSKKLGQNFLTDKIAIKKIIKAAELKPADIVLEIGPGLGALTEELVKKARKVLAVEKDEKLCEILKEKFKDTKNLEIVHSDILKIFNSQLSIFNQFSISNYKVVANLPFYLTAPVIRRFLELDEDCPRQMTLVVQKEVGQRICANPGRMSILAVSVQVYAQTELIDYISKNSFWPKPKVDSAIIRITPNISRAALDSRFFEVVKAGFSQPRKQLVNNLSKKLGINRERTEEWLLKNGVKPTQRAETLSVQDWQNLTKTLK